MQTLSASKKHLTTSEAAERLGLKPATMRHNLCKKGHCMGLKPSKMPNGRLLWELADIERLFDPRA